MDATTDSMPQMEEVESHSLGKELTLEELALVSGGLEVKIKIKIKIKIKF
jgi:bacteriocin-like protein